LSGGEVRTIDLANFVRQTVMASSAKNPTLTITGLENGSTTPSTSSLSLNGSYLNKAFNMPPDASGSGTLLAVDFT